MFLWDNLQDNLCILFLLWCLDLLKTTSQFCNTIGALQTLEPRQTVRCFPNYTTLKESRIYCLEYCAIRITIIGVCVCVSAYTRKSRITLIQLDANQIGKIHFPGRGILQISIDPHRNISSYLISNLFFTHEQSLMHVSCIWLFSVFVALLAFVVIFINTNFHECLPVKSFDILNLRHAQFPLFYVHLFKCKCLVWNM